MYYNTTTNEIRRERPTGEPVESDAGAVKEEQHEEVSEEVLMIAAIMEGDEPL